MSSRFAFLDIHSLAWFGKGRSSVLKKKQHVLFFDPIPLEKDHATNERITLSNFSIFLKIGLILSRQWGPLYLESIEYSVGRMLWGNYHHKFDCQETHDKWEKALEDLVPIGTMMSSEQIKFRANLKCIEKQHLKEIDNIWREPIREWTNRYKRITGKFPDVESTNWGCKYARYSCAEGDFNSYLESLVGPPTAHQADG